MSADVQALSLQFQDATTNSLQFQINPGDIQDGIFTVSEEQIVAAMRLVWERMKLIVEPSAAVGVAVVLGDEFRALPGLPNVGVVLCGGNVALDKLYWR